MKGRTLFTLTSVMLGAAALMPATATALVALPTSCADLLTMAPLAGNPAVFSATSVQATTGGRSYCNVQVTWRDPALTGSANGYAPGSPPQVDTFQSIRMGFALPLNTNTDNAAWGGRLIMTAGGGAQGSVPGLTGMIGMNPAAIGAGTDSGHGDAASGSGDTWGVIQGVGLNEGKIKDWAGGRANGTAVKLAKQLAVAYYGDAPQKTYWNGCSGGGHMGWAQIQNYPDEYDGALIGAPAFYWQQFRLSDSWGELVFKKVAQQTSAITAGQMNAANAAATAACDGADGVTDGIVADPRACTWSAANNVCGQPTAPAAPNCLDSIQAAGINSLWDGPRNSYGKRIWYPYDRGVSLGVSTATQGSTVQVMRYNHADNAFSGANLYADQQSINMAGNPPGAITYEDEAYLGSHTTNDSVDTANHKLDAAEHRGIKIIVYHGLQDPAIQHRHDIDFYRRVATYFGNGVADLDSLRHWYRLFLVPGAGHCPAVPQALNALIDWRENGNAPDSLVQTTGFRKLCPFPQTAIWNGVLPTTDASNFTCGGNLEANPVALCTSVRTQYKAETGPITNTLEVGIDPRVCQTQRPVVGPAGR